MQANNFLQKHTNIYSFLFIFLGFFLTSGGYLSWLYHLMELAPARNVDFLTEVLGYLVQALGLGLFILFIRTKKERAEQPAFFTAAAVLYVICLIPSLLSGFLAATLIFGYLMNLFVGVIAGSYLYSLAFQTTGMHNGLIFGGGYAAATVAAWLLSLLGGGSFLRSPYVLIVYIVLTALLAAGFAIRNRKAKDAEASAEAAEPEAEKPLQGSGSLASGTVILAILTILLFSLVKNLGFSFPAADVVSGVSIELSRIFYAAGLVIAGLITDKSRKYGAICALASLVIPFVMIALSGEPVSGFIFWALNYFFFGFFSVYRVILFTDLAGESGIWVLAPLGLLFGRISDAVGTGLNLLLGNRLVILLIIAVVLFIAAVLTFFILFQRIYGAKTEPAKSERELFEQFAGDYTLSAREREVLRLIVAEKTNSEIADSLCVSESTVKFHVRNLLKKTECKNRIELLSKYISEAK